MVPVAVAMALAVALAVAEAEADGEADSAALGDRERCGLCFPFSNPREILSELIVGLSPIRITEVCTEGRRIRRKDPPARKQDVSNKR